MHSLLLGISPERVDQIAIERALADISVETYSGHSYFLFPGPGLSQCNYSSEQTGKSPGTTLKLSSRRL